MAVSAENGPSGRYSSNVLTGTSGTLLNVLLVIPALLMNVLPVRSTLTPSPCSTTIRRRERFPTMRYEIHRPRQPHRQQRRTSPHNTHDRRCRTTSGIRFELRRGARFLQRRQTRRQLLRQFHFDTRDVRLTTNRSRGIGHLRVEAGTIGFARFPWVETVKEGLNSRLLQPPTPNGLDVGDWFSEPEIVAVTCCTPGDPGAPQLVGLNMKSGRSMLTVIRFKRNGTPSKICGIAYGPVSSS